MEKKGSGNTSAPSRLKVWTFLIQGGNSFSLLTPKTHFHEGVSLLQIVADSGKAMMYKDFFESFGANVQMFAGNNKPCSENPGGTYEYQTDRCGLCYFFDPDASPDCGFQGWTSERIAIAMRYSMKAVLDAFQCPQRG